MGDGVIVSSGMFRRGQGHPALFVYPSFGFLFVRKGCDIMSSKKHAAILATAALLAVLHLQVMPPAVARAGASPGVASAPLPDGLGIWEGGGSFHVMYNGVERTLATPVPASEYLVASETYTDVDGAEVTAIYFNFSPLSDNRWEEKIGLRGNEADEDGEMYYHILLHAPNSYWDSEYCPYSYYITIKDGVLGDFVLARRGSKNGLGPNAIDITLVDDTSYGRRAGRIYKNTFFQGKYTLYCSSPVFSHDTSPDGVVYPATPLPGTPPAGGAGGYPFKTTFRMLTEGALAYNTFYYTSSYMSGTDEVSASGKIRCDMVKLADGTMARTLLSAPQLLCQKSTYGTAYDIVSTNDNNLLTLLGIEKPVERYWDVAAQEWKVSIGSGIGPGTEIPGTGGGTPTPEPGVGLDYSLSPLANFSRWLQAKGYPVAAGVAYLFAVESVEDFGELLAEYLGLYTYNETTGKFGFLSDGTPDGWKRVPEVSIADMVTKEFTDRFSYDALSGHHVWSPGDTSSVSVPGLGLAIAPGAGGSGSAPSGTPTPTPGGTGPGSGTGSGSGGGNITIGGPGWGVVGEFNDYIQTGISDGVSSAGSFLSGVLSSVKGILLDMGAVPALLAELFSFLPAGITTIIGVGLGLWLLPALLGLARGGIKAAGGMFSSLFRFIASFFS